MKLHKSVYELWNKLEECCAVATFLKQELDVLGVVHRESIAAGQGVEQRRLPFGDENKAAMLKDNNWIELSVSEVLLGLYRVCPGRWRLLPCPAASAGRAAAHTPR